jgi:hypothetical protein
MLNGFTIALPGLLPVGAREFDTSRPAPYIQISVNFVREIVFAR